MYASPLKFIQVDGQLSVGLRHVIDYKVRVHNLGNLGVRIAWPCSLLQMTCELTVRSCWLHLES